MMHGYATMEDRDCRSSAGDALAALVSQRGDRLMRIARSRTDGDEAAAADALQAAYLSILAAQPACADPGRLDELERYTVAVLKHEAVRQVNGGRRVRRDFPTDDPGRLIDRCSVETDDPFADEDNEEQGLARARHVARLREVLANLPESQREAVGAVHLRRQSYQHAARRLGTSVPALKKRAARARLRIFNEMRMRPEELCDPEWASLMLAAFEHRRGRRSKMEDGWIERAESHRRKCSTCAGVLRRHDELWRAAQGIGPAPLIAMAAESDESRLLMPLRAVRELGRTLGDLAARFLSYDPGATANAAAAIKPPALKAVTAVVACAMGTATVGACAIGALGLAGVGPADELGPLAWSVVGRTPADHVEGSYAGRDRGGLLPAKSDIGGAFDGQSDRRARPTRVQRSGGGRHAAPQRRHAASVRRRSSGGREFTTRPATTGVGEFRSGGAARSRAPAGAAGGSGEFSGAPRGGDGSGEFNGRGKAQGASEF